jgi:hypothetical protein
MDIETFLGSSLTSLSKKEIGAVLGTSPSVYKRLIQLAFSRNMPACWRAAWMMDYLAEIEPVLPEQHIELLWQEMSAGHPDGVKRSTLRLLSRYDIPEELQGVVTDLCLDWLQRESVPVAIKAYSMDVLLKIATLFPELAPEFITIIEHQLPYGSGGYVARARMVIGAMEKL